MPNISRAGQNLDLVVMPQPIVASANACMTPVGFEPTQLALVELESTPLEHSGKVSRDSPREL